MPSDNLREFIEGLARKAGQHARQTRERNALVTQYKQGQELVTQADVEVDEMIRTAILARFPDHAILSEELSPDLSLAGLEGPLWVVDPIDGTVNYAYGHSQSAVSIAYLESGVAKAGVVYNPFSEELFAAEAGQGATLNGRPVHCREPESLRMSLVATGFPYHKDSVSELCQRLEAVLQHCRDLRRLGSAALDICWVACGRLDAYYETVSPWDLAAARLIALEAGASCGHFGRVPPGFSEALYSEHVLITAPGIYQPLREILAQTV